MPADRSEDARLPSSRPHPVDARRNDVDVRSVVVRYESSPDRRTIYPADVGDQDRLTLWISADDEAFVSLDARR